PSTAAFRWPRCTGANGQLMPSLPSSLVRSGMTWGEWTYWRMTKQADDARRRELGQSNTSVSAARRIGERGFSGNSSLRVGVLHRARRQTKEKRRPFVCAVTLELPTDCDDEILSWIAAGPRGLLLVWAACGSNLPPPQSL